MMQYGSRLPRRVPALLTGLMMGGLLIACTPTVQVAAPKEPITVNLNVKIQHEIYVKVDKDVDELFSEKGLF
ncbi:YnbE family lipoprotein [Marinobacter sp. F3R11]|nr:YnbE family lipoprotein [Marinobacter sp. F3R11]RBW49960.1 YnbE family lipoprotein [Marinobacter sp. F3R11]